MTTPGFHARRYYCPYCSTPTVYLGDGKTVEYKCDACKKNVKVVL